MARFPNQDRKLRFDMASSWTDYETLNQEKQKLLHGICSTVFGHGMIKNIVYLQNKKKMIFHSKSVQTVFLKMREIKPSTSTYYPIYAKASFLARRW